MRHKPPVALALDLGAESGRAIAGRFDGRRLELEELHRFPNRPVLLPEGLCWNALGLFSEIRDAIGRAAARFGPRLVSAGVDTWGVDFGLLDRTGGLLAPPVHYRDARTGGEPERVFRTVPRDALFRTTGNQIMQLNTLFQLTALSRSRPGLLRAAHTLLFMPDLFHYWLTGRPTGEETIASTSQCFRPRTRSPARALLRELGLPDRIFAPPVRAGERIGPLRPAIAEETGARGLAVVAPGAHDTASAVAAVPLRRPGDAFLSSGTWSILGMERPRPCLTAAAGALNFTNEAGVCGRTRLMKNIMGLWLVQECRRVWSGRGEAVSYEALAVAAERAPAFRSLIDPNDARFLPPGDMPGRIRSFCRETGQPEPRTRGEVVRAVLESLALTYARVLGQLRRVTGETPRALHVVGGGSRNGPLNRFTACATGLPVIAGPVEATAAGNLLMQLLAAGQIASLEEGREVIRRSFPLEVVEPGDPGPWAEAAGRLERICGE